MLTSMFPVSLVLFRLYFRCYFVLHLSLPSWDLQDDLNKLIEWSEKWQMLFNFGKCKCLHTGHGNEDAQYTMGGTVLNTTLREKDLGLTISADMTVSE